MNIEKVRSIFIPGALPTSTYITRKSKMGFTYEERLRQALTINGYLTVISGPSKIGKTVLCEKVIGLDSLVEVSGADFENKSDFWGDIAEKSGMPVKSNLSSSSIPNEVMTEQYVVNKDSVINYFVSNNLVLLLDDFHYASDEMQTYTAQQFKDAIRKGLKAVIASLPHRSEDSIITNPDLQGRISMINIEPWTKEELMEIPLTGFKELDVRISDEVVSKLAEESICSPHLMQLICLSVCIIAEDRYDDLKSIPNELLNSAFRFSTSNFNYNIVFKVLKQGKNSRGKERTKYKTKALGYLDLYGLILEALAIDPPFSSVGFTELVNRINSLVDEGETKPKVTSLREYLKNLQEILDAKGRAYSVIEWRDERLYILEPLFLFYLRWGRDL